MASPARHWLPVVCAGLSLALAACTTTRPSAPDGASTSQPAPVPQPSGSHPLADAVIAACRPAIVAGEPLEIFVKQRGLAPAPAFARIFNTRIDQTFSKSLPEGRLILGMMGDGACVVAVDQSTDLLRLQQVAEDVVLGPDAPWVLVKTREGVWVRDHRYELRRYSGVAGQMRVEIETVTSPNRLPSFQAAVLVRRSAQR